IICYCLIAIIERDLNLDISTFELLRILNVSLFERKNLKDFLKQEHKDKNCHYDSQQNLNFF
ncbi:MAG: IS4 family transposase, partial [Bacteroides sp.]|nr:IS4 family transposase [Bacteroides sp.]